MRTNDSPRIEVACAARHDYLPHAATMLASVLANAGAPPRVHLLIGDDVTDGECAELEEMLVSGGGALSVHRVDGSRVGDLKTTSVFPASHWYRVLLADLLAPIERVLYLDADTIAVDSLLPLWEAELGDDVLAAVTNVFPDPESGARLCAGLGVDPGDYFNSGVMLLDLAGLREIDAASQVIDYARANPERLFLPEQDAMNAVLAGRRRRLAPRWNAMNGVAKLPWSRDLYGADAVREAVERPAIRHFEGSGSSKPWSEGSEPEARDLYGTYRARTPWPLGSSQAASPQRS
jgi:lipopolysaccharide biosynthesis glycosyltransferase